MAADDEVDGDDVHDALGNPGELAEQAPGVGDDDRLGHAEAADPPGAGLGERGLDDRRPDEWSRAARRACRGERSLPVTSCRRRRRATRGPGSGRVRVPTERSPTQSARSCSVRSASSAVPAAPSSDRASLWKLARRSGLRLVASASARARRAAATSALQSILRHDFEVVMSSSAASPWWPLLT